MRRAISVLSVLVASAVALTTAAQAQPSLLGRMARGQAAPLVADGLPGQVVVGIRDGAKVDEVARRHGADVLQRLDAVGAAVMTVDPGDERQVVADLRADPGVAWAEPDIEAQPTHADCAGDQTCPLPNDPLLRQQWYLQNDAHTVAPPGAAAAAFGADIDAPLGWQRGVGSTAVHVAIVDSGVDFGHPDLAGHIISSATLVSNNGDAYDYVGHGTFVAGIIGARWNNSIGIAGVDPNAALMIVKDSDDANSDAITASAVANAIVAAVDGGAQVINISQGTSAYTTVVHNAVNYAWNHNALVIAAAGNDGSTATTYPAAEPNAISVGATDIGGRRASFSNFGTWVLTTAPGKDILSTQPTYPTADFSGPSGDPVTTAYAYADGTSFSAPIVAAVAATIWPTVTDANHNGFVNDDVVVRLLSTTDPDRTAGTSRFGAINLCQALAGTRVGVCPVPPPPPPPMPPVTPAVAAPSTNPPPAALPTPTPSATKGLPVPAGYWTGRIRVTPATSVQFTVAPSGRALVRAKAQLKMRCAHHYSYGVQLYALGTHDQQPLDGNGSFAMDVAGLKDRYVKRLRFHVTGQLRPDHSGHGTVSASAIGRKRLGRCRTGTLTWALP